MPTPGTCWYPPRIWSPPWPPVNTYVREGTAGQKVGETLEVIKPEAVYFSNKGNGRSGIMIVNAEDASQFPHVAETLFLNFDATVNWHIAMLPRS